MQEDFCHSGTSKLNLYNTYSDDDDDCHWLKSSNQKIYVIATVQLPLRSPRFVSRSKDNGGGKWFSRIGLRIWNSIVRQTYPKVHQNISSSAFAGRLQVHHITQALANKRLFFLNCARCSLLKPSYAHIHVRMWHFQQRSTACVCLDNTRTTFTVH